MHTGIKIFKKYRFESLCLLLIILLYFVLRIVHIMSLPIFTDEAIYTRWTQIAKQDANWRFISLTDGKQPLFIWINILFMKFVSDPLLSGRLVSVAAGFGTLLGLFFTGREIFKNTWVGLTAAFLYVFFPFGLVYDRMALYDSLVGTFSIWSLYIEILLIRKIRLDIAFVLGLVTGGSVLNKSSGFFNLYLLPVTLILFDWRYKQRTQRLIRWISCAVVAVILTYGYYSILRLSPFYHIIGEKDATFVFPFREWIQHPFTYLIGNGKALLNWFLVYMTWPVVLLAVLSYFVQKKFYMEKIVLSLWFLLPYITLGLFGKLLYPRYIFFMVLPLLILAGYSLFVLYSVIKNKYFYLLCAVGFLSFFFISDYYILTDFAKAPLPKSDLDQYINDWPAGGGVNEAVQFFKQEASDKKIYIATEGTFGLMPYSMEIYLVNNPNITIHGYWPIQDNPPAEALAAAKKLPVYFVFYQPCVPCSNSIQAPINWKVKTIATYHKGSRNRYLTIYQLLP